MKLLPGHLPFTRRRFLQGSAAFLAMAGVTPRISLAGNPAGVKLHGLSSFGDLKYEPDFDRFSYARPKAPQGGSFAFSPSYWYFNQNTQTFNTLNTFILKGEAPPRLELCYDTLMTAAWDEPDSLYCALAKTVEISEDRNRYRFELRPEARFHDGSPITAHDVAFSFLVLRQHGHPQIAADLTEVADVAALDAHTLEIRYTGKQSDRAILAVAASVPILSKAFYTALPFKDHVMELPLTSGPWKVGRFSAGSFVEYERVRDYWAADLGFARGLDHFDRIRIDFFRERQAAFEAFKKGVVRWREEFTSKTWATEYDFPAIERGDVVKHHFPGEKRPSLQGWALNTRRGKFADRRTREAISLAFDFEWTNRTLFYGAYTRSHSIFEKSGFAADDLPSPQELALLEPFKADLPKEVFSEAVRQFETDGSGRDRRALRRAQRLLEEAGWQRQEGAYVNEAGEKLEIEFLIRAQVFERILGPFTENLRTIGIPATIRLVDPSQFQARLEDREFDIAGLAFSFGATPAEESIRQYFHSQAADRQGSYNYPGIKVTALDALIGKIGEAASRAELTTAMKALDRVLRAYRFWIPNWHAANHRVAMWDVFGWGEPKPDYFFPVERLWWFDADKARKLGIKN